MTPRDHTHVVLTLLSRDFLADEETRKQWEEHDREIAREWAEQVRYEYEEMPTWPAPPNTEDE